uniref:Thyrotropin-releasing hormone receptor n=1 Tax=Bursaphelenchus xylophilus TaxID=6326 RepID=A0A1I7S1E8_BURXY
MAGCTELFHSAWDMSSLTRLLRRPECQQLAAVLLAHAGPTATPTPGYFVENRLGFGGFNQEFNGIRGNGRISAFNGNAGYANRRVDIMSNAADPTMHTWADENFTMVDILAEMDQYVDNEFYPLYVRVGMTFIFALLAVMGIVGNIMVITVVLKVPGMITPTNCYLTSLAASDCLFFIASLPQELNNLHGTSKQYIFGSMGCSLLSYLPYLAINTSSLSITAFTIERFIGICHPLKARYICTVSRAKLIIALIWIFGITYNSPWLYLATVMTDSEGDYCSFKLERSNWTYKLIYVIDFLSCYLVPMILYLMIYAKITYTLMKCTVNSNQQQQNSHKMPIHPDSLSQNGTERSHSITFSPPALKTKQSNSIQMDKNSSMKLTLTMSNTTTISTKRQTPRSRMQVQVIKMLAFVVIIFAVCWLPYRAMVMYNSFVDETQMFTKAWYLFFAKTLIFFNCAINPILYNVMSARFRNAFKRCFCGAEEKPKSTVKKCTSVSKYPLRSDDQKPFLPGNYHRDSIYSSGKHETLHEVV